MNHGISVKWTDLEKVVLEEIIQTQKDKCCIVSDSWVLLLHLKMRVYNLKFPQKPEVEGAIESRRVG